MKWTKQSLLDMLADLHTKVADTPMSRIRVLQDDSIHSHRQISSEFGKELQLVDGAMVNVGEGKNMGEAWNINIIIWGEQE